MTLIDAVILDFGNVLVTWDPVGPFVGVLTRSEVAEFFEEIDFATFNHAQDAGRSWQQGRAIVAEAHPDRVHLIDLYFRDFAKSLTGTVPGSAELVADLHTLGLELYGLTNWAAETFPAAAIAAPSISTLKDVVVSGEVGCAKPDPKIFDIAIAQFGVDPSRTVFFDDLQTNVDAARNAGLHARLFTTAEQCRTDLRELGIMIPVRANTSPSKNA